MSVDVDSTRAASSTGGPPPPATATTSGNGDTTILTIYETSQLAPPQVDDSNNSNTATSSDVVDGIPITRAVTGPGPRPARHHQTQSGRRSTAAHGCRRFGRYELFSISIVFNEIITSNMAAIYFLKVSFH